MKSYMMPILILSFCIPSFALTNTQSSEYGTFKADFYAIWLDCRVEHNICLCGGISFNPEVHQISGSMMKMESNRELTYIGMDTINIPDGPYKSSVNVTVQAHNFKTYPSTEFHVVVYDDEINEAMPIPLAWYEKGWRSYGDLEIKSPELGNLNAYFIRNGTCQKRLQISNINLSIQGLPE